MNVRGVTGLMKEQTVNIYTTLAKIVCILGLKNRWIKAMKTASLTNSKRLFEVMPGVEV